MESIHSSGRRTGRTFWQDIQCIAELLKGNRMLIAATEKVDADKTIARLKDYLKGKTIVEEPRYDAFTNQVFINELSELPEVSSYHLEDYTGTIIYLSKEPR